MVDMLVKKLNGQPFETELPIPKLDRVPIAPAIKDLSKARIALSEYRWYCTCRQSGSYSVSICNTLGTL